MNVGGNAVLCATMLTGCASDEPGLDSNDPAPLEEVRDSRPSPFEQRLQDQAERAGLVAITQVIDVEYGVVSAPFDGLKNVPVTYVSFRVDDPYEGCRDGETFTLQFTGGLTPNGDMVLASDIPLFDVGDRDLLFVTEDNGTTACPLVDCGSGRLREHDGLLFTDDGRLIVINEAGQLGIGRRYELREAFEHHVGGNVIRNVPDESLPPIAQALTSADGFYVARLDHHIHREQDLGSASRFHILPVPHRVLP